MLQFDVEYYLQQNPDVADAINKGLISNAYQHFQTVGWKEGRNPNPLFDVSYYLKQNPDIADSGIDPFAHFNSYGSSEGRNPTPFFDVSYYLQENPDVAESGMSPFEHYMAFGAIEGRNPSSFFDASFYFDKNSDVQTSGINPLLHWLTYGVTEDRDPSAFFDVSYYLKYNPDVAAAGINPFLHFLENGAGEGRFPTQTAETALGSSAANFDEEAYLAANPDVAADIASGKIKSAYEHFVLYGAAEGLEGKTTNGAPIEVGDDGGDGDDPDEGDDDPDDSDGGVVTPPPPPSPVASLQDGKLTLVNATDATLTTNGSIITISAAGYANINVARSAVEAIDLNGHVLKMSGAAVDTLFPSAGADQIDITGFGAGGKLDITSVNFGDITKQTLQGPNVWLADGSDVSGFTFSELDGLKSVLPDGVTVNGSVADAFKAWWDAYDDYYASGNNYYNELVNTQTVYLGNDYVEYLHNGGEAILDIAKTSGDYTNRQQTLHDNLLGNLIDAAIQDRFVSQSLEDPRTDESREFGDRPYSDGNNDHLQRYEDAKAWDLTNSVSRADADLLLTSGALSAIASDGSNMWNGSGISNDHFRIVQNTAEEIELGLKVSERGVGDYPDSADKALLEQTYYKNINPTGGTAPSWNIPGSAGSAENVAAWSFNFSIATNIDQGGDDPQLSDYKFKLVFDVDPTEGTSYVTYVLDPINPAKWLFESAESADVRDTITRLLGGDLTQPLIDDNVGENDNSTQLTHVAQNSQNYGFADSLERFVNAFLGNDYNSDGTKIADTNYWEAETHPGNFQIGLEAYTADGASLLAENYISVGQKPLVDLSNGTLPSTLEWVVDRAAPQTITAQDGAFAFNINEGAETSGFYRFQGARLELSAADHQYIDAVNGTTFSADFYIDPNWATDRVGQESGLWMQMQNTAKTLDGGGRFSIAEYLDADAITAIQSNLDQTIIDELDGAQGALRFWNSDDGWAEYVAFNATGWVNLEFRFEENSHSWYVNGNKVYEDLKTAPGDSVAEVDLLETAIFNSVNYGVDETYLYDNIKMQGVSTDDYFYV